MGAKEKFDFQDDEQYPAEMSASGDNAYYIEQCSVVGHRPAYASCLCKVADRKEGRLQAAYAECSAAIGKKMCPAQRMRKEELAEGKAIYFISRIKLRAYSDERAGITGQSMPATPFIDTLGKSKGAAPIKPAKADPFAMGGSYADAINAALKPAEPKRPEPEVTNATIKEKVSARPAMLPGESLMAYAKRVREMANAVA